MKRITKIMMLAAALTGLLLAGCDQKPDIQRSYDFHIETLPVAGKLAKGQTAEIRCRLVREGRYAGAKYTYRYFQPDGKGTLRMEDGPALAPNDLYDLGQEEFRMYYTSLSEDRQVIDIYFLDNGGRRFVLSLAFNASNEKNP